MRLLLLTALLFQMFEPTPMPYVRDGLKLAGVTANDIVYDLGSGDGRIVIMAAKDFGARAAGSERERGLVDLSWVAAQKAGVKNARFIHADLFEESSFCEATVIFIVMGVAEINQKVINKVLETCEANDRRFVLFGRTRWKGLRHLRSHHAPGRAWMSLYAAR